MTLRSSRVIFKIVASDLEDRRGSSSRSSSVILESFASRKLPKSDVNNFWPRPGPVTFFLRNGKPTRYDVMGVILHGERPVNSGDLGIVMARAVVLAPHAARG